MIPGPITTWRPIMGCGCWEDKREEKTPGAKAPGVFVWRSGRDSNPRAVSAATRFPIVLVMTTSIPLQVINAGSDRFGQRQLLYQIFWIRQPLFFPYAEKGSHGNRATKKDGNAVREDAPDGAGICGLYPRGRRLPTHGGQRWNREERKERRICSCLAFRPDKCILPRFGGN